MKLYSVSDVNTVGIHPGPISEDVSIILYLLTVEQLGISKSPMLLCLMPDILDTFAGRQTVA